MSTVSSLGHVGIYVRDIERSKAFYRDIVGLKVNDESVERGLVFMGARDRVDEHHELVLFAGREDVECRHSNDQRYASYDQYRCEQI